MPRTSDSSDPDLGDTRTIRMVSSESLVRVSLITKVDDKLLIVEFSVIFTSVYEMLSTSLLFSLYMYCFLYCFLINIYQFKDRSNICLK